MSSSQLNVFTIGHSNHPIVEFIALLERHGIEVVADVRSHPFSRFNPQYNRRELERSLNEHGIRYVFLGRELGARSDDPACYESGRVVYARLASTDLFRRGVERVLRGAEDYRIALMCAEKDPLDCHRTVLVARALAERGVTVHHLLADGSIETHEEALSRLLDVAGLPQEDLFRSRQDLIAEALAAQEKRIAFVNEAMAAKAAGDAG